MSSTMLSRCACRCREVLLRAATWENGNVGAPIRAILSHDDVDCRVPTPSPDLIATPFRRFFPVYNNDAECTRATATRIWANSGDGLYNDLAAWQIEQGDEIEQILAAYIPGMTPVLWLDLERMGPPVTVTALFATAPFGPGDPPVLSCSTDLLFPSHIELTQPASIDVSAFDLAGTSRPDGCALTDAFGNWIARSTDVFTRQGPASLVMRCVRTGEEAINAKAYGVYELSAPSGVCARAVATVGWVNRPGGGVSAAAGIQLYVSVVDRAYQASGWSGVETRAGVLRFTASKWLTGVFSLTDLQAFWAAKTAHTPPNCGPDGNGLPCAGHNYPCSSPLRIYGGTSMLESFGGAANWLTGFTPFYMGHIGDRGGPCADVVSVDPLGRRIWLQEYTRLIDPSLWTNNTFGFAISSTTPAEPDADDCECVTDVGVSGLPERTSVLYLGQSQAIDVEPCECAMSNAGNVVDVFPRRILTEWPDSFDLSPFLDGECYPTFFSSSPSYVGDGELVRDPAMPRRLVFGGDCENSSLIVDTSPLDRSALGWAPYWRTGPANFFAYVMHYAANDSGGGSLRTDLWLTVGYLSMNAYGSEPDTLVRFYTHAYLQVRLQSGGFYQTLALAAGNIGPEGDIAGMTTAEVREFATVGGLWGWAPNWNFSAFALSRFSWGHYVPGGVSPCTGSLPSAPNDWYCQRSLVPGFFRASQMGKESGGATASSVCPPCDAASPADWWAAVCMSQHGDNANWTWPLLVRPTVAAVDAIDSDAQPMRYVVP